jgi:hypothetical protein
VTTPREAHTELRNREVSIGQAGTLIAAERPVSPEATKACRAFVLGWVPPRTCFLSGAKLADPHGSLAQEGFGGQGALVQPGWTRGCVHTQHAAGLHRR